MEQSSQTAPARRQPRPWTEQDQQQAEAMRAEGFGYRLIGKAIDRSPSMVKMRLEPLAAQQQRERCQRYRAKDPAKDRARCLARRLADPEWARARTRAWAKNNPEKNREKGRRRDAWRRAARRKAIVPVSFRHVQARFRLFGGLCAYCGIACTPQADHVLALVAGGLDEASNIVPACISCNSSKRDCAVESWYRRQPFFSEERWRKIQRHCPHAVAGQLPLALAF